MTVAAPPRPPREDELEALIEEARRRARRRRRGYLAALVLVAALAGVALYAWFAEGGGGGSDVEGGTPASSSELKPATLFLAGEGEMWVVDVDAERAEHLRVPDLSPGDAPHHIASIGDRVALWGRDVTSVPVDEPSAPPETIARDGWIFIPAADPNHIWVGFLNPERRRDRALGELREIDAQGNVITRGITPPGGAWPYAELSTGLLFQNLRDDEIGLWDPGDQRTVRTFSRREIGDMGPVSGDLLASGGESGEELILTDFATGEQRRIPAPRGRAFVVFEGAFSPDGATLAVPVKEAGRGGWSNSDRELALVSLEDGVTEIVPGSLVPPGYVFTVWSPDGGEVYLTGGGFRTTREIIAYRLGDDRARTLAVEVGKFYDVASG